MFIKNKKTNNNDSNYTLHSAEISFCEKQVQDIQELISAIPKESDSAVQPTREQFTRLLAELAASRRVPGISCRMNEIEDYQCSEEEQIQTREFLKNVFHIDSKERLLAYQQYQFRGSVQYEQFMTFWKEEPLFDINELNSEGRNHFERCKSLAEVFYPILQEKGFYAIDINDYIGVCRVCKSCGIITAQDFDEIVDRFVRKALVFYHSFKEYAMACLCGALYNILYDAPNLNGVEQFMDIQKKIITNLFEKDAPWQHYAWYKPEEREWVQIYPGNPGCFVTKMAIEKGIGYMYRENGSPNNPDSGWRFFHGDESDSYANNIDNIQVVSLNTICNLRPDILVYLEASVGSAYGWDGKEWIRETLN